jgi:hypothetical protein
MFKIAMNSMTLEQLILVAVAFFVGIFGAWKIHRTSHKVTPRVIGVFTFCYLIWIVSTPTTLGWRYPEITVWTLIHVSALYWPILVGLVVRYLHQKSLEG